MTSLNSRLFGELGQKISVTTNCFEVTALKGYENFDFHQYEVAISPDLKDNKKMTMRVIDLLQTMTAPHLFEKRAVFDGRHILFCPESLKIPDNAAMFEVTFPGGAVEKKTYSVKLVKVATVNVGHLRSVLNGGAPTPQSMAALQLLNLLVRQAPIQRHPHKVRSFYVDDKVATAGAYEIWSGVFQSVKPSMGRILINIDTSTAVMYRRGWLIDVVMNFLELRNIRDLELMNERHAKWSRLSKFLKSVKVEVRTAKKTQNVFKLEPCAGSHKFAKDEVEINVETYYKRFKNISLEYPRLPGIRTKSDAIIPFELCQIIPGQFYRERLPPQYTATLLKYSTRKPQHRLELIKEALGSLNHSESDYVRRAGVTVSKQALSIPGRVLRPPSLSYKGDREELPRDGSWNLRNKQLRLPGMLRAWSVVSFDRRVQREDVDAFVRNLVKSLTSLGIGSGFERGLNEIPPLLLGNPQNIENEMNNAGAEAIKIFRPNPMVPTLILAIIPSAAPELRRQIKKWGDVDRGVATQVVNSDKIKRANDQYFGNLALKINVKIGGINMIVSKGIGMKWFSEQPTMIIGADVSHPGPGIKRPSIAGIVSSVDNQAARYVANISVQPCRQEIIENLTSMTYNALEQFYIFNNKVVPARIVFYRDGVSEGEFYQIASDEFEQIKKATALFWDKNSSQAPIPKITFIVVGKRHHVRFFPQFNTGDRSGNCPSGLVVDTEITNPNVFDFFLQSHGGLLGTSRPGHYIVLRNENNMTPDLLQGFSYDLCHLYARATRAVSIPAPVYYADIVCSRADIHFNPDLHFSDDGSEATTSAGAGIDINVWRNGFKPPTLNQARNMYFM